MSFYSYLSIFLILVCIRGSLSVGDTCEYVSSLDGSYYDLSPMTIRTRAFWNKPREAGSDPRANRMDASITDFSYWNAYVDGIGTIAFNPCGVVQNRHEDCPTDADGKPTESLVVLQHADDGDAAALTVEHRRTHCVGYGDASRARIEDDNVEGRSGGVRMVFPQSNGDGESIVHLVCGKSTGEITNVERVRSGKSQALKITLVTKYACARRHEQEEHVSDAVRRREKQADRKARQKLAATMSAMQQARLLHPKPQLHRPVKVSPNVRGKQQPVVRTGGAASGKRQAVLDRMNALSRETVGRRPSSHRQEVLQAERSSILKQKQDAKVGRSSAANVDLYRQLLAKKRERDNVRFSGEQGESSEGNVRDAESNDAMMDELEDSIARERSRRERVEHQLDREEFGNIEDERMDEDADDFAVEEDRLRKRQEEEWKLLRAKRVAQKAADAHHSGHSAAPRTYDDDDEADSGDEYHRRSAAAQRLAKRATKRDREERLSAQRNQPGLDTLTLPLKDVSNVWLLLAMLLLGVLLTVLYMRMRAAKGGAVSVFEYATSSGRQQTAYNYEAFVKQRDGGEQTQPQQRATQYKKKKNNTTAKRVNNNSNNAMATNMSTSSTQVVEESESEESSDDLGSSLLPPAPGAPPLQLVSGHAVSDAVDGKKKKKKKAMSNGQDGDDPAYDFGENEFDDDDDDLAELMLPTMPVPTQGTSLVRRTNVVSGGGGGARVISDTNTSKQSKKTE